MNFRAPDRIDLGAFAGGTACLTPAVCANLAEAATVCLEHQGHAPGVELTVGDAVVAIAWEPMDPRAPASHADLQDATEEGAVALAIELVRKGTGLDVVRRSRKGTGFDYHLGSQRAAPPFAASACLEVSGILVEDDRLLSSRVNEKVTQVIGKGSGLPGFAVVVGFAGPRAVVRSFP